MMTNRKTTILLLGAVLLLAALIAAATLLPPSIFSSDIIKRKLRVELASVTGAQVTIERAELFLLPRPGLTARNLSLHIHGLLDVTIESLTVTVRLLPLLAGEVQLAEINAEAPLLTVVLPDNNEQSSVTIDELEKSLTGVLQSLGKQLPDVRASLHKGALHLLKAEQTLAIVEHLEGRSLFPPAGLEVELTGTSDLAGVLSLRVRLPTRESKGYALLLAEGFNPRVFINRIAPNAAIHLGDGSANVDITLKVLGPGTSELSMEGSVDHLAIRRGSWAADFGNSRIKAISTRGKEGIRATLTTLETEHPRLRLTGSFQNSSDDGDMRVELRGNDIDVTSTRQAALTLAGDIPLVHSIFAYVRAGTLPNITFTTRGTTIKQLSETKSIVIEGSMERGAIFIPGPGLDFQRVYGDCVVRNGMLYGSNLVAQLGKSQIRHGTLSVGLKGSVVPLQATAEAVADAADIRELLLRVIQKGAVLEAIREFEQVSGNIEGRVSLGDDSRVEKVSITVPDLRASFRNRRVPYPVVLTGGELRQNADHISVRALTGRIGTSTFSGLTGRLNLSGSLHPAVTAAQLHLSAEEVFAWIKSSGISGEQLKEIASVRGALQISSLTFDGPVAEPAHWRLALKGASDGIMVASPLLPGTATLSSKGFEMTEAAIKLWGARLSLPDTSLLISASLGHPLHGFSGVDLDAKGSVGPHTSAWIKNRLGITVVTRPLSLSLAPLQIGWIRKGVLSAKGNITVEGGPQFSVDFSRDDSGATLNRLIINDDQSRADLTLQVKKELFDVRFSGELNSVTVDKIFPLKGPPEGKLTGDFSATAQFSSPPRLTSRGTLDGMHISLPFSSDETLKIDSLRLDGGENRVALTGASLAWGDERLSASGQILLRDHGILLDADIATSAIRWNSIQKFLKTPNADNNGARRSLGNLPLHVQIRLTSDRLIFKHFSVEPLLASISVLEGDTSIVLTQANVCGISLPGTIGISGSIVTFDLITAAQNQSLNATLSCLGIKDEEVTGRFDLSGSFSFKGREEDFMRGLRGKALLDAAAGRIYQDARLVKILSLLNLSGFLPWRLPDILQEGFSYRSIRASATLDDGVVSIRKVVLDSPSLRIVAAGKVDVPTGQVSVTALASPFRTIDFFVEKIPLFGKLISHRLLTVPLLISGKLDDPDVSFCNPSKISTEPRDMMEDLAGMRCAIVAPPEQIRDSPPAPDP